MDAKKMLEAANRLTFRKYNIGQKLIVTRKDSDEVDYCIVTGFSLNNLGELILVLNAGPQWPNALKLHPGNKLFTIEPA